MFGKTYIHSESNDPVNTNNTTDSNNMDEELVHKVVQHLKQTLNENLSPSVFNSINHVLVPHNNIQL